MSTFQTPRVCSSTDILAMAYLFTLFRNRYLNPTFVARFSASHELIESYTLFKTVYKKTVPAFIWKTLDDTLEEITTTVDLSSGNTHVLRNDIEKLRNETNFNLDCTVFFN